MSLTLTNIPNIMRHKHWNNGAALMDRWFAGPMRQYPNYQTPDTSTIKMAWALGFGRANAVYRKLVRERIWANAAAQPVVAAMLKQKGLLGNRSRRFGNLTAPVNLQDPDYINQRGIGSGSGVASGAYSGTYYYAASYYGMGMDDMVAAMGNFNFRVLVAGVVAPATSGGGHVVTIDEVGIYLRDSFDFEGSQHLGFWDDSDNSVSAINFLSGTRVTNKSFRDWRTANQRGGDFLVYSDLRRIPLTRPDSFRIP